MGEFLSVPNKKKISEDTENTFVREIINIIIYNIDPYWSKRNARMEKAYGGFSHSGY
jgi:hypothetical protein